MEKMTTKEMKIEIMHMEMELHERERDAINAILKKLFHYHIAIADPNYKFLKEIENDLREYKINFL